MNNHQTENKTRQVITKVKKDFSTLEGDNGSRFTQFENDLSQATGKAKKDLFTRMEAGVSRSKIALKKMTTGAKQAVTASARTAKEKIGRGLGQYNAKAQDVADQIPGGFGREAAKYPWVIVSIALVIGLLLGNFFKSGWRSVAYLRFARPNSL